MNKYLNKQKVALLCFAFAGSIFLSSCNLFPVAESKKVLGDDVEKTVQLFLEEVQGGDFAENDYTSDYLDDDSSKDLKLEETKLQDAMDLAWEKMEFTIEESEGSEEDEEGSSEVLVTVIDIEEVVGELGDGYNAKDLEKAMKDKKAPVMEETVKLELSFDEEWIITDASELFELYSKPFEDVVLAPPAVETTQETTEETTEATETTQTNAVENESMTLTFSFGTYEGVYTGEVQDGLPHGFGTFESWESSDIEWYYEGDWVNGHMEGQGITEWIDGWVEEGTYANDYLNGEGKKSDDGRTVHEGNFKDNVADGYGTSYDYNGEIIYQGNWAMGFIDEAPDARTVRIDAYKATCSVMTQADMYAAASIEVPVNATFSGTVFFTYDPADGEDSYCDFLMYVDGVEADDHFVLVYHRLSVGEARIAEGQTVTVSGSTQYLYAIEFEEGVEVTMPVIQARCVE